MTFGMIIYRIADNSIKTQENNENSNPAKNAEIKNEKPAQNINNFNNIKENAV